jgi:hypothetical protein
MKLARLRLGWVAALYMIVSFTMPQTAGATAGQEASGSMPMSTLDFVFYRTRIEPMFLKQREGGVMCYSCHSVDNTRFWLEPLLPTNTTWTEEQSRRNFAAVLQLVTPGEPMKSRLLLHPLSAEAGGDPTHTGGKFWKSPGDPEFRLIAEWIGSASPGAVVAGAASPGTAAQSLDFEFFKTHVQPIFLKRRPGHPPCFLCHASAGSSAHESHLHLEVLSPGSTSWTEEQTRRNFEVVSALVTPGDPLKSRLLLHPLSPDAGGDVVHGGGRQFLSQDDPDWQTIAEWVRGRKADASSDK